jgi:hypothetical protein
MEKACVTNAMESEYPSFNGGEIHLPIEMTMGYSWDNYPLAEVRPDETGGEVLNPLELKFTDGEGYYELLRCGPTGFGAYYSDDGETWSDSALIFRGSTFQFRSTQGNNKLAVNYFPAAPDNGFPHSAINIVTDIAGDVSQTYVLQTFSGITAGRPALPNERWPTGAIYFDTSLGAKGKPLWVNKTGDGWVDASGATV